MTNVGTDAVAWDALLRDVAAQMATEWGDAVRAAEATVGDLFADAPDAPSYSVPNEAEGQP